MQRPLPFLGIVGLVHFGVNWLMNATHGGGSGAHEFFLFFDFDLLLEEFQLLLLV